MSQQTEAELSWQVGPESCMILGVSKQGQRYLIQGRLEVSSIILLFFWQKREYMTSDEHQEPSSHVEVIELMHSALKVS